MTLPRRTKPSHSRSESLRSARRGRAEATGAASRAAARGPGPRRPPRRTAARPHLPVGTAPKKAEAARSARRTSLTGRAAVLALVVCMLAISLAYPLREYLSQRAEIADYRAKVASQSKRVAELEAARERWRDPAYVRSQARTRLHFVMPGETQYVVLEPDEAPVPGTNRPNRARQTQKRPWFGDLWRSVEVAGRT